MDRKTNHSTDKQSYRVSHNHHHLVACRMAFCGKRFYTFEIRVGSASCCAAGPLHLVGLLQKIRESGGGGMECGSDPRAARRGEKRAAQKRVIIISMMMRTPIIRATNVNHLQ